MTDIEAALYRLGEELAIRADERERIGAKLAAYADNYPADVFPEWSKSTDALAGTAMRHAYRNAARLAREVA